MRCIAVVVVIALLGTTVIAGITPSEALAGAQQTLLFPFGIPGAKISLAPVAISGDNVYVTWWNNKTGNDEVNLEHLLMAVLRLEIRLT